MRNIISLFAILLISLQLLGQIETTEGKTPYSLNEGAIDEFRSDSDFNYTITHIEGESLWSKIKRWLSEFFRQLFSWSGNTSAGKVVVYVLIISAIVFFVLKILKVSPNQLIKKSSTTIPFNVQEEDIHAISFDQQIQLALDSKNFKLAVRLTYLSTLKHLSDIEKIHWEPGKSNHDYCYELGEGKIRVNFEKLSSIFEVCWYGGFDVTKSSFNNSREYSTKITSQA